VVLTCSDPSACNYNEGGTCIIPINQACERYALTITPGSCAVRTWSAAGFDLNDYYGLPCGEEYPDTEGYLSCTFVMPRWTPGMINYNYCLSVAVSRKSGPACAEYIPNPNAPTARIQRVGPSLCLGNGETSCYQEAGEHDVILYGYGSLTLCSSPCTAVSCDTGCESIGCV
jgi:hypothetical protein